MRVAIDGRSAAGKTPLANSLVRPVEARDRPVIRASVDDFLRPAAERHARGRMSPEGYYFDEFDYPAVRERLFEPFGPGGTRRYRTKWLNPSTDRPFDEAIRVTPDDATLLCDGIFLFRPELNDLWDFRIFVDINAEHTIERGVQRDQVWIGSAETARERYLLR